MAPRVELEPSKMAICESKVDGLRNSKRLRCSLFFLAAGFGIGAWASSLPLLSAKGGFDKGHLGSLLLCFALGAIVLMINVGRHIDRLQHVHLLSFGGSVVFGVAIAAVPFTQGSLPLAAVIFVAGAGFGTLDVSMNTEASQIELQTGRHLMSSFHALFSIGNIAGAFLIGKLVAYGGGLEVCLASAGSVVIVLAVSTRGVSGVVANEPPLGTHPAAHGKSVLTGPQKALLGIFGTIGFLALLAEGGMMDWTAVYMVDTLGSSESQAAYAFAVFSGAMACGRLMGDSMTRRFGHVRLLRLGGAVCATSVALILVTANTQVTLAALALCGLGVANMVPAVFASAGRVTERDPGKAIAIVTTMGYSGLLLGPALLGFLAQATHLRVSFGLIAIAFVLVSVLTLHRDLRS